MPALDNRGRAGRSRRMVAEINVVPYIDVMLVLLVIFMVTAPMLPPGSIDLPSAGRSQARTESYIEARLLKGGRITLATVNAGESLRAEATLRDVIAQARRLGAGAPAGGAPGAARPASAAQGAGAPAGGMPVVISADRDLPYGEVVALLDLLQRDGIRAALMVKPAP
jgi:biopolymer transport protein TolR